MEKICSKCGVTLIEGRLMTGAHMLGFSPLGEEKKLRPKYTSVFCDTCSKCGEITNIRVEKPEIL